MSVFHKFLLLLLSLSTLNTIAYSQHKADHPIRSILILGNSIVYHEPEKKLDWKGKWGMAATVKDSDFVHLLIRRIHAIDPKIMVRYANISSFETDYTIFPLPALYTLRDPDIIIMKLAENVNDYRALQDNFIAYYSQLLDYLDGSKMAKRIIVDGFWKARRISTVLKNYAGFNGYPFVSISDLSADPSNTAVGQYRDSGVQAHPSNKGMRMIADRIWVVLKELL